MILLIIRPDLPLRCVGDFNDAISGALERNAEVVHFLPDIGWYEGQPFIKKSGVVDFVEEWFIAGERIHINSLKGNMHRITSAIHFPLEGASLHPWEAHAVAECLAAGGSIIQPM